MFGVVGCRECGAFWIVRGNPETTGCPRCGTRHDYSRLKKFARTDDEAHARDVRSRLLAERSGSDPESPPGSEIEDHTGALGSRSFVDASGLRTGQSASPRAVVFAAISTLDVPTEAAIVEYAAEYGISGERCRAHLDELVETGELLVAEDQYAVA